MSKEDVHQDEVIRACMGSLRRIVKALENYARTVEKRFDLTGPQLWALWELDKRGPMGLKDLAALMQADASTLVGIVDRLVAKGMMIREADARDKRRVLLVLTESSRDMLLQAPHPAQGHLLSGLKSLKHEQVENLYESLGVLERVLGAQELDAPFFFPGSKGEGCQR